VQKPLIAEIREMFWWSLQQMLPVAPMHFNTALSSSSHRGAHSVENSSFHSTLLTGNLLPLSYWSALNAPKSSAVSTTKVPEEWGQEIVRASWVGLRVLATVHRKSGSDAVRQWGGASSSMNTSGSGAASESGEHEVVPHHAWITCVIDEESHVPRELVNHSPKNDGTLHLLVC
jgi:hypothetical protein